MADDLGYKGKVTWVTVQNSYTPKGYTDYLDNEARIYEAQSKIVNLVDIVSKMLNSPTFGKDIIKGFLSELGNTLSDLLGENFSNNHDSSDGKNNEESTTEIGAEEVKRDEALDE